jgi:SAM-dependent methyltransferase
MATNKEQRLGNLPMSNAEPVYRSIRGQVTGIQDEILDRYLAGRPPLPGQTLAAIKRRGLTFEDWKLKWRVVLKQANLQPGQRQLDVGCGAALLAIAGLQNRADYYGADLSTRTLAYVAAQVAAKGLTNLRSLVTAEARALPFAGASFDIITAIGFSEYWPLDYLAAGIAEMARLLVHGGRLIFDVLDSTRSGTEHSRQIEGLGGVQVFVPTYASADQAFARAGLEKTRAVSVDRRVVYNLVKVAADDGSDD